MKNNNFETLKKEFEQNPKNAENLIALCQATSVSVLKKIGEKSGNKKVENMIAEIIKSVKMLECLQYDNKHNRIISYDKNGKMQSEIIDKAISNNANDIACPKKTQAIISLDLVNECAKLLLIEYQSATIDNRVCKGFLDIPYITKSYNNQVVTSNKKPVIKELKIAPIQRVFRGLRAYIQAHSGIQSHSLKYAYISIYDDNFDTYYLRAQKNSFVHISDAFGSTEGMAAFDKVNKIVDSLKLSKRERQVLDLLFINKGLTETAKALSVSKQCIAYHQKNIQKKAEKIGFTPFNYSA